MKAFVHAALLAYLVWLLYFQWQHCKQEHFVPIDVYEAPEDLSGKQWAAIYDKFGQLMQMTNAGNYAYPIKWASQNLRDILLHAINAVGVGKFVILSIGDERPFTLFDVIIQDSATLTVSRFSRVDFIISNANPYIVHRIIMTAAPANRAITPQDTNSPLVFGIYNSLHLFSPYRTTADEMT